MWLLCACGERGAPSEAASSSGAAGSAATKAATAAVRPVRVISIAPSTTEALFAIGAGGEVVGVSRYCDFPPEVAALPKVGGFVDPSLEAILALSPSLIVGSRSPTNRGLVETLESRNIAVYFPLNESFDEIRQMLRGLGQRTGHVEGAEGVVRSIDADLSRVAEATRRLPRPRVLLVFDHKPLAVAGPGSFADAMLRAAGADNAVERGGAYPILGVEQVLALSPTVIIESRHTNVPRDAPRSIEWDRYPSIPAVREDRVLYIADDRLQRPGPRVGEAVVVLARALHPGLAL